MSELLTATETGRPVGRRIADANAMRYLYEQFKQNDLQEAARRVQIRRMYEGYLPYSQEALKKSGIKDLCNLNFHGLRGKIENRAAVIDRLQVDTTLLVELHPRAVEQAGPEADRVAKIVAEEFSTMLRDGGRMIPAFVMMNRECDLYGLGPVTWKTSDAYIPTALERGQVKFDGEGPIISSDHEIFMFESVLPASYLFDLLDKPDLAKAEGWNVEAVRRIIVEVFAGGQDKANDPSNEQGTSTVETQIALMRQNRTFENKEFDRVNVLHAYVKEVSGDRKISHLICAGTDNGGTDFMCYHEGAYDNMDQCMLWMPYAMSENYARSLRGIASYLVAIEDVRNRLMNRILDTTYRAASFMVNSKTAGPNQSFTVLENGPYTVLPSDFVPSQSQISPNFQILAGVHELVGNLAANNAAGTPGTPQAMPERIYSGADRKTKDEARAENAQVVRQEEALFTQRVTVMDKILRETFRRAMLLVKKPKAKRLEYPEIQDFIDNCERRGVAKEILLQVPDLFRVYTCRDLVLGANGKAGVLEGVLREFGGQMPESGRNNAVHDIVTCRLGRRSAERYTPEIGGDAMPSNSMSHAVLENNTIKSGANPMVGFDQLHWVHIRAHMQIVGEIAQAVQAGQMDNPQAMLQILELATGHIREHLQIGRLQIGMEPAGKQVDAQLRELGPIVRTLSLAVSTQQRVQEAEAKKQQAEMEELQRRAEGKDNEVKIHEIDVKAGLKQREQDLLHQARMAGVRSKAAVENAKAGVKADIDTGLAAQRMENERLAADMKARQAQAAISAQPAAEEPLAL